MARQHSSASNSSSTSITAVRSSGRGVAPASKKVSIVFRAELTVGDERAARLSPKTRTPPESAALGGSGFSGTLIWWCTKGFCYEGSLSQIHGRGQNFLTERRAVGFLRHLANILARSHCWAIFLFECHN